MSEKFTASNGVVVAEGERGLSLSTTDWRKGREAIAELFLHERDKELGRWRDPEYPSYAVYELTRDRVRVVDEDTGNVNDVNRGTNPTRSDYSPEVAKAYFDAHPVKEPWHDAKPGEVWVVTWAGTESVCVVELLDGCVRGRAFVPADGKRETPGVRAPAITAARRIYPEN